MPHISLTRVHRAALVPALAVLALAAPSAAGAATLSVELSSGKPGSAASPSPTSLTTVFYADKSAPLGTVTLDLPQGFRLGGASGDPTCSPDQIASDADSCPDGSNIASGTLSLSLPPELQPADDGSGDEAVEVDLEGYEIPGGGLEVLAIGYDPQYFTAVVPLTVSGSTMTLDIGHAITQIPGAGLEEFALNITSGDPSTWVRTTGCTGTWGFTATAGAVSARTSQACPVPEPSAVTVPDLPDNAVPSSSSRATRRLCGPRKTGVRCAAGNGRRTRGGGGKKPSVTGILWIADDAGRSGKGSRFNDEMLGGNGSDRVNGGSGDDVLWGDQRPFPNGADQRDKLSGGAGGDWIYTSKGTNTVDAGSGNDHVYAYYGKGTVNCGAGSDTVYIQRSVPARHYKLKGCEHRKYL